MLRAQSLLLTLIHISHFGITPIVSTTSMISSHNTSIAPVSKVVRSTIKKQKQPSTPATVPKNRGKAKQIPVPHLFPKTPVLRTAMRVRVSRYRICMYVQVGKVKRERLNFGEVKLDWQRRTAKRPNACKRWGQEQRIDDRESMTILQLRCWKRGFEENSLPSLSCKRLWHFPERQYVKYRREGLASRRQAS